MNHYYQSVAGWFDSAGFYREMVARCPDGGTMVEVGCWQGRSLCCLLVEAKNSGKRLNIIGVDHWQGSVNEPKLLEEAAKLDLSAACMANCQRSGYPFRLITGASVAVAESIGTVDFVFLDASHDGDSVRADIRAWRPKIRKGGILAGHDAHMRGVADACLELIGEVAVMEYCWWKTIDT